MSTHSNPTSEFNGELDRSFGENGRFIPDLPSNVRNANFLGVTKDENNIYIAGSFTHHNLTNGYMCCRVSNDGKIDTDFGNGGYATGSYSDEGVTLSGVASQVIIQSIAGVKKILLIGSTQRQQLALVRLNSDGSLDRGYGREGQVILNFPLLTMDTQQSPDSAAGISKAIALEDAKVILLYRHTEGAYIIRVKNNGSLDETFNGSGYRLFKHTDEREIYLTSLLETTSSKYLLGGAQTNSESPNSAIIIRLLENGTIDREYGEDGIVTIEDKSIQNKNYEFNALAPQHNDRTAAFGVAAESTRSGLIASLEPDGSRNIQFNGAQPVITQVDHNHTVWLKGRMLPNGQLQVLGLGEKLIGADQNPVLVQYNADGTIDKNFGRDGIIRFTGDARRLMEFDEGRVLFTKLEEGKQILARGLIP